MTVRAPETFSREPRDRPPSHRASRREHPARSPTRPIPHTFETLGRVPGSRVPGNFSPFVPTGFGPFTALPRGPSRCCPGPLFTRSWSRWEVPGRVFKGRSPRLVVPDTLGGTEPFSGQWGKESSPPALVHVGDSLSSRLSETPLRVGTRTTLLLFPRPSTFSGRQTDRHRHFPGTYVSLGVYVFLGSLVSCSVYLNQTTISH